MDILNERIMQDGKCFPGGILKVDSFINHQMDPTLMMQIAEEFKRIFDGRNINKIITIEASGIAPAILVGYLMRLPVVFIKKKVPKTMERMLVSTIHSFTKTATTRYASATIISRATTTSSSSTISSHTAMPQWEWLTSRVRQEQR